MLNGKRRSVRARVLVKAYPQPSRTYDETVCVAAVSEDGSEMLRLYPIRFRHLPPDRRFGRFDLIEMETELPKGDTRPESRHVIEDSIRIVGRGTQLPPSQRIALWHNHVASSLTALIAEQKINQRSFGIVRPDAGSVRFFAKRLEDDQPEDRDLANQLFEQQSLLEDPLKPLQKPTYNFGYRFTSDGHNHCYTIFDWEVQTAWFNYQRRYGNDALDMMKKEYGENIPSHNLHLIFGNQHKRPWQFIVIGLLRSTLDPDDVDRQEDLFAPSE